MDEDKFRVLCIDGGGMRGVYTACYLDELQRHHQNISTNAARGLDVGKGFDLIVGTSTGGIIGLGLAFGVSPAKMLDLYKINGSKIFGKKMPSSVVDVIRQFFSRPASLKSGDDALKDALTGIFGSTTIGKLYLDRGIAIAVPAVDMQSRKAWVFKSKHLSNSNGRDDGFSLVDVCRATSAAPLYRSLANVDNPGGSGRRVFADGGLCANSPVMIGLLDALSMARKDQEIEIFTLGTCKPAGGSVIPKDKVHWGFKEWKFGGVAAEVSIDAQEKLSADIARLMTPHLNRPVSFIEFPREVAVAKLEEHLSLDETRPTSIEIMEAQARADANLTLSQCADANNSSGQRIKALFSGLPSIEH